MQRAADKNQTLFVPEFLNFRCSQEAMSFEQQKNSLHTFTKSAVASDPWPKTKKWFLPLLALSLDSLAHKLCHLTDPKNRSLSPTFPPHR